MKSCDPELGLGDGLATADARRSTALGLRDLERPAVLAGGERRTTLGE